MNMGAWTLRRPPDRGGADARLARAARRPQLCRAAARRRARRPAWPRCTPQQQASAGARRARPQLRRAEDEHGDRDQGSDAGRERHLGDRRALAEEGRRERVRPTSRWSSWRPTRSRSRCRRRVPACWARSRRRRAPRSRSARCWRLLEAAAAPAPKAARAGGEPGRRRQPAAAAARARSSPRPPRRRRRGADARRRAAAPRRMRRCRPPPR